MFTPLVRYQSVTEWQSGLVPGTFFHSVVSETTHQFETSIRIRNLASMKASCSTCVNVLFVFAWHNARAIVAIYIVLT